MMRRLKNDTGQAVILTAFMLFAFGLLSALSVDVGVYMVDRRDAQSDVDKAALAGAIELTLESSSASVDGAAATAAANEWAVMNGIDPTAPGVTLTVETISTCYSADDGVPTGVEVSLVRPPASFFMGIVNAVTPVTDWNVKTSAIACAGRPIELTGMMPFAISETPNGDLNAGCFTGPANAREPKLGAVCSIVIDNSEQGRKGFLSITNNAPGRCTDHASNPGGAPALAYNIEHGVQVNCAIGDLVKSENGNMVNQVRNSLAARLATDGACENALTSSANYDAGNAALFSLAPPTPGAEPLRTDGIDDFFEIWAYDPSATHPAIGLVPRDCNTTLDGHQTSPRNVVVIIIRDFASTDAPDEKYRVTGFARVYIEGCTRSTGQFEKDCTWTGGGPGTFTLHVRFVEQVGNTKSNLGLDTTYGDIEVFLKK